MTAADDREVTPDPLNGYLARILSDGAWASSNEATRHIRQVLGFVGPDAIAAAEARGVERLRAALAHHLTADDDPCQDRGVDWPCDVAFAFTALEALDQDADSARHSTPHTADGGEAGVVEGAGGSEAAEGRRMDCPERCEVPAGVHIVETPPAGSDVVRCRVNGCERTFLVILDA